MGYQNYTVLNKEPRYITATDIVTPSVAKDLMSLVDDRGCVSEWDENPHTLEYQIANPFSRNERNIDAKDLEVLPELFQVGQSFLRNMNRDLNNTICEVVTGYHGFWIMKYEEGAEFAIHSDWGTSPESIMPPVVATLTVKLNDNYEGGELSHFAGPHSYGVDIPLYGGAVHDGFTDHKVSKITKGSRYALVIHYTGSIK
tara:strand:- start:6055 stop:6654 length:600 start_codon:yes stop_codon:yes gene_type:complete